jgi:hypothetical protein
MSENIGTSVGGRAVKEGVVAPLIENGDKIRKMKEFGSTIDENIVLDIICNWKTDFPKPNGNLIFTDVKVYGTAIHAYTLETIEFLETYSCGTDEILKELRLSLCPETIVCLSRNSARAWKRFLHQLGIPVETNRHQTTRGMLMAIIFSEDKIILECNLNRQTLDRRQFCGSGNDFSKNSTQYVKHGATRF